MGFRETLSSLYFSAEDRYYSLLDKLQKKTPVYSVVDPVDKILPSFGIILALVVALVGFGLVGVLGSVLSGEKVSLSLTMNDSSGDTLSGVVVSLEKDGTVIESKTTSSSGKVVLSAPAGTYQLRAAKEGYESLFQEVELTKNKSQIFTLKDFVSPSKQRALLIQDSSGNVLGVLSTVAISLSFSCQSGTPPANQTSFSGNVTFLQPGNCSGLSVNVSAAGFISKTETIASDTTVISLQSSASLSPPDTAPSTGGTVEIIAKNANGTPIEQAQIKLYKIPVAGSNVLVNQSLSDPNGLSVFDNVTPGKHVAVVSKTGFKQTTSTEFQVNAGETISQTITVPVSSNKRKIFVKIVSSLNQLPVSGAQVTLFAQTSFGNFIEYDTYTSDSNGMVNQLLADFNGNTSLLVEHSNYVTDISSNTGIVPDDQPAPIPILLDPLQAASANGTIPNALIINVKVSDEVGLPVNDAAAFLHTPDLNGITLSTVRTNALGVAKFSNLPAGTYRATVETPTADGNSASVQGSVGQIVNLPVTVTLGNALIKITVKDELNSLVTDANVSIYSVVGDALLASGVTNTQGLVQLGVASGQQVYVNVSKPTYLPFVSVPFDVIKNNTHAINIEVSLVSSSQAADISLQRIDQISSSGAATLAQSLSSDGLYAFHFIVKSLVAQNQLKSVVRLNGNDSTPQSVSDVGRILGGQSAKGALAFYTTHNVSDAFSPSVPVDSNTAAKVALNTLGDVSGAASYELVVFVKIKSGATTSDKLDVRFQAKSAANISSDYFESFTIGQPLNQGNFSFVFFVTAPGTTVPVQINSAYPLVLEKDLDYRIDFQVSNTSGSNHPNAVLNLLKDVGTLSTSVNSISAPMNNNASVSGNFTLRSTVACASNATHCATLTPTLNGVGGSTPPAFPVRIFTTPAKTLYLTASPAFIIPGQAQLVQAFVKDQSGALAGTSQGVSVKGIVKDSAGVFDPQDTITFTQSSPGLFFAMIPVSNEGDTLEVSASASGYFSAVQVIPISNQILFSLISNFSCVTVTPASTSLTIPANGALTIQTTNCPEPVKIYTAGYSPSIELKTKTGNTSITQANPLLLATSDSKNVTISPPVSGVMGLYPLYIFAQYASQSTWTNMKNVDVMVNPISVNPNCLSLSSYSFDVRAGSQSAYVENNCDPGVHDAFSPSVSPVTADNHVYVHPLPSLLTPEMRSPGSDFSFGYQVSADYNFSLNADVNHDDFARFVFGDANWNRFEVSGSTTLLTDKSAYAGAPVLRPDSIFSRHCNGCPNDAHFDYFLEDSQNLNPLVAPPGPVPVKTSVLYETTFVTTTSLSLDRICFMIEGVTSAALKIDGITIPNAVDVFDSGSSGSSVYDCAGTSLTNVVFAPGPHIIQFFWHRNTNDSRYAIKVKYQDAPFTNGSHNGAGVPLSNGHGRGFYLSPENGSTFNVNSRINDLVFDPSSGMGSATLNPLSNVHSPKSIGSLNADLSSILGNENGMDHLKVSNLSVFSDNPSVRAFVKENEVYAQYVGFDNFSTEQQIVVENLGFTGEKYSTLRLSDYTLPSPSAANAISVGVLVDSSPSLTLNESGELQGGINDIRQQGICDTINQMRNSIRLYTNATVNFNVFLMDDENDTYHTSKTFCGQNMASPSSPVPFTNYDPATHDLDEAWAWGAEQYASNSFFSTSNPKVMIIITDNKPTGLGDGASANANTPADDAKNDALVASAVNKLSQKDIRGVVLYKTPLESTAKGFGDVARSDAIEWYETFASGTRGFVEAFDFSEKISTPADPNAWEDARHNKVGVRLAQTVFPQSTQDVVVKMIANPANACIGENGEIGYAGSAAVPKILLSWGWNDFSHDACDFKINDASNYRLCDGTQFLQSLVKKLELVKRGYSPTAPPDAVAAIPSLMTFDTYLMSDNLNSDFRSDFVDAYTNSFFNTPTYFYDIIGDQWKDFVLAPDKLKFEIEGESAGSTLIPRAGLYRVTISVSWPNGVGNFFAFNSPDAVITVKLTPLSPATVLPGFSDLSDIPLDGFVGFDSAARTFHRDGYGTAFTGAGASDLELVLTQAGMLYAGTNPGLVARRTLTIPALPDAVGLNTDSLRGVVADVDLSSQHFALRPSLPAPIALQWESTSLGVGDVYYRVSEKEGVSQNYLSAPASLLEWSPYASKDKQSTYGCVTCNICLDGGDNPFVSTIILDQHRPSSSTCSTSGNASELFGFTSTSFSDNNSFLSSIFYRTPSKGYDIVMGCAPSPSKKSGAIQTMNASILSGSTPLDMGSQVIGNQSHEEFVSQASSYAGMLNLLQSDYTCVSSVNGKARVFWNAEKLRTMVENQPYFSGAVGNACTAVGAPASPALGDPSPLSTINGSNFLATGVYYRDVPGAQSYLIYRNTTGAACQGTEFFDLSSPFKDLAPYDINYYYSAKAFSPSSGYSACSNVAIGTRIR